MEVLVIEDTKEIDANFVVEDDGSVKKKRRRRVSFAQTQTVHFIPRHDDIETPPLLDGHPHLNPSFSSSAEISIARVSTADSDVLPASHLHENSVDFSQFTCDMDTGHGSWADEDFTNRRSSFDGLDDDSGCFVHLGHISQVEDDDDSIVNDVLNDEMTMDATTFSKNLSHYLKSSTTFDLQGTTGPLGQVLSHKKLNDSDSRSEDDSMALTKVGAPHWALINPQDVSMHADDDQSDMSLATATDRVRAIKKRNRLTEENPFLSSAAQQMSPAKIYSGKSSHPLDKQKENLAPQMLQDGLSFKAQTLSPDPHCDSDISMSLSNTMDISIHQTLSKRSDVLISIDGNTQTPPMSRRRSDNLMQDTSFSASDFNTTVPVCNLKDLLLDHTDYTSTRHNFREADSSTGGKILDSHISGSKPPKSMSGSKHDHSKSQSLDVSKHDHPNLQSLDHGELRLFPDDKEVTVGNRSKISSVKADHASLISDAKNLDHGELRSFSDDKEVTVGNRLKVSSVKEDHASLISDAKKSRLTDTDSTAGKKATEEIATSMKASQDSKLPIAGFQQGEANTTNAGKKNVKQQNDEIEEHPIKLSKQSSALQSKPVSSLFDSSRSASILVVEQSNSQFGGVHGSISESKPVLVEVKKRTEGQQPLESSLQPVVADPGSFSKSEQLLKGKIQPVSGKPRNLHKAQQLSKGYFQEDKKFHHSIVNDQEAFSEQSKKVTSSKVPVGVGRLGGVSMRGKDPCTKGPRFLEDVLQRLEVKSLTGEDQAVEEDMVPMLPMKLHTLTDYLQFSCSVQPQADWLSEHIQELEAKHQAAKKRNAEIKSSSIFVEQMLPEESTYIFKAKLSSKMSLAKKGWLLWKMNPQRQILALLQESKDNLIKEVEAVHGKGQQVLHLKELYSQLVLKRKLGEPSVDSGQAVANFAPTSKEAAHHQNQEMERRGFSQTIMLEKCRHHYQDACERLNVLKAKWDEIQTKIQGIASVHGQKLQSATDNSEVSFDKNLEASLQRLLISNSLLQQQQVMQLSLKSIGGKSLIDFSLEGMCSQRFQFEEDNPLAQVQLSRTLHPEEIELAFPCMDASLFFQYINSELHSTGLVQIQHVYRVIQRTNWLFGSLMDVLKEIKYCRRIYRTSCKFQTQRDKLLLCVTFLQCNSGLKVTLTFDMLCVKGGGYPSDLKPAEVQIQTYGCPLSSSITRREVLTRIAKLQPGYGRLHRICSCVEELMRSMKDNA